MHLPPLSLVLNDLCRKGRCADFTHPLVRQKVQTEAHQPLMVLSAINSKLKLLNSAYWQSSKKCLRSGERDDFNHRRP